MFIKHLKEFHTVVTPREPLEIQFGSALTMHNETAWLHPKLLRRHAKVIVSTMEDLELLRWMGGKYEYQASQLELSYAVI